jgi:hypothetical protein
MSLLLVIIISSITITTTLNTGLYVWFVNRYDKANKTFLFLCSVLTLWMLSGLIADSSKIEFLSIIFARLGIVWVSLIPFFYLKLIREIFLNLKIISDRNLKWVNIIFISFFIVTILSSQTSLNIKFFQIQSWGLNFEPGYLYFIVLIELLCSCFWVMTKLYFIKKTSPQEKKQANLLIAGTSGALLLGISTDFIMPSFGHAFVSIFAPFSISIFLTCIIIAINKHNLFNVRILIIELCASFLSGFILARVATAPNFSNFITEAIYLIVIFTLCTLVSQSLYLLTLTTEEIDVLEKKNEMLIKYQEKFFDFFH